MACGHFPPIYGHADKIYDEDELREMLNLKDDEPCVDYYGHYKNCIWAVIECKSKHLRNAFEQLESTVKRLRENQKTVDKIILVADTFGKEYRFKRRGKELYQKRGNNIRPLKIGNIIVEGWQPNEIGSGGVLNDYQHMSL
jgi:hypothetical protein